MRRQWLSRQRWRLRGAWQWPSFAALTVADAILLHQLPPAGDGPQWAAAALLATFFNLLAVAVVGPPLGVLVRRRRPDLPFVVAANYGGTAALVATAALLLTIGLLHRPGRRADRAAFVAQSAAVRRFVAGQAPPEFRRRIDEADSLRFAGGLYRTCVPGPRPDRAFCVFVDTTQSPPGLRVDPNRAPNATYGPAGQP